MAKDSFYVFNSMHREEAEKHVKDGDVVVYNMGLAIREVDEEGHRVPIGHYGVLPESNSILEGLIEAGSQQIPMLLWAMNGHPLGCT